MLLRLRIENLAVVEDVTLELGAGLNALTGSTGAGKSLIVGAVNLLLGGRAAPEVIRAGRDEARIEAVFEIHRQALAPAAAALIGRGGRVVVVRRVTRAGRSHAAVNDQTVTLKQLREVCAELIEPHGQNEPYRLRDPDRHVEYIDAFASNEPLRARYAEALAAWRIARAELDRYDAEVETLREKRELYAHRLDEIARVAPLPGEKAAMESQLRLMASAEKVFSALSAVSGSIYDDDASASSLVGDAERRLAGLVSLDARIAGIAERLAEARASLAEAAAAARGILERMEFEPAEVDRIQERLHTLVRLERRYNAPVDSLIEQAESWRRVLAGLEDGDDRRGGLEAAVASAAGSLGEAGRTLGRSRREAARTLDQRVTADLQRLMMRGAALRTDFEYARGGEPAIDLDGTAVQPLETGLDRVRLRVRTNPGEAEGPIEAVASSGELSRIALALKESTATGSGGATLIFDEIDAGVGADLGEAIAQKLLALSKDHQIICITHMPQIAARAHLHLVVLKESDGNRTRVRVQTTEGDDRTREIARMLGGAAGSERRLALASEMLATVRRGANEKRVRP